MLLKLVIWISIILTNFGDISSTRRKNLQIRRFLMCPEYQNVPMELVSYKKRTYGNNTHHVEMTLLLRKKIGNNFEGAFSLQKCDLSGTPDSCEYYLKDFKMKQICKKMSMKDQVWSNFVDGFKPPVSCPIEPGTYEVSFVVTEDVLKFFPVPRGVWKARVILYVGDEMIMCSESEVRVIY